MWLIGDPGGKTTGEKKIKDEINIKNHKQLPRTDGYLFSNWQGPSKRLASMHINRIL